MLKALRLLGPAALLLAAVLGALSLGGPSYAQQAAGAVVVSNCGTPPVTYTAGQIYPQTQDTTGRGCGVTTGSVTANITGFRPTAYGTPIAVTSSGVTGTLPAGTEVVASNAGSVDTYCQLGASATTSSQLIKAGGWFAFAINGDTQLTCITSAGTTTVNTAGGSGLPTGSGGGGGGSGSAATTTQTGGSVTTSGTFQSALASSASRKSCLVQNTSTDIEYVFFGANGSATTSNSFALGAAPGAGGQGGSISCNIGGNVATDNVAITSKTTNGATYVVSSQ